MSESPTVPAGRAAEALAAVAGLGGYFHLDPGTAPPLADLITGDALAADVERVRAVLQGRAGGPVATRVAASIHSLGLFARLVSAPLATGVLFGLVPMLTAEVVGRPGEDGSLCLRYPVRATATPDVQRAAAALQEHVVDSVTGPLVEAFAQLSVSRRVLWGNVASALAGAAGMITRQVTVPVDPRPVVTAVLASGPLASTGTFDVGGRYFRRASCCLYYRLPGGGTCGDCVLTGAVPSPAT